MYVFPVLIVQQQCAKQAMQNVHLIGRFGHSLLICMLFSSFTFRFFILKQQTFMTERICPGAYTAYML